MARVTFGGGVTAIDGSIGGWTFQNTNSGYIIRTRPSGKKSISNLQSASNQKLTEFLAEWNSLSLAEKTVWNTFGGAHDKENKFGRAVIATGYNWFFSINFYRDLFGLAVLSAPPTYSVPTVGAAYTLLLTTSNITMQYDSGTPAAVDGFVIFASPMIKSPTPPVRPVLRFLKVLSTQPTSNFNLTTEWEDVFGINWPPNRNPPSWYITVMLVPVVRLAGIVTGAEYFTTQAILPP